MTYTKFQLYSLGPDYSTHPLCIRVLSCFPLWHLEAPEEERKLPQTMSRSLKEDISLAISNCFPALKEALMNFSWKQSPGSVVFMEQCSSLQRQLTLPMSEWLISQAHLPTPLLNTQPCFANGWMKSMDSPPIKIAGLYLHRISWRWVNNWIIIKN